MNRRTDEYDLGWRKCATCGVEQRAHHGHDFDHGHRVRPGDEWCDRCDDLVVNGCGSPRMCDELAAEDERELEEEAGGPEALAHNRGSCLGAGMCRWCDEPPDPAELDLAELF